MRQHLRVLMLPFFVMVFSMLAMSAHGQDNAYTKAGLPVPIVTSDKEDYYPGEIAIITGTGWSKDQVVDIHFEETPQFHTEHQHDFHGIAVDENGNWRIEYPIEERHLGVTFDVHVIGKQTGYEAHHRFTDGPKIKDVTVGIQGSSLVSGIIGSTSFNITVNRNSGTTGPGTGFTANLTISGLPDGVTGTFSTNPVAFNNTQMDRSSTLTLTSTNGALPGSFTFVVQATVVGVSSDIGTGSGTLKIKSSQTIGFNPISNKIFNETFALNANASSGLPVTYSIVNGLATISGNNLTTTGVGSVIVRASQSGNDDFGAAPSVEQTFTVNKADATITLGNLEHVYNNTAKAATASTSPAGLNTLSIIYKQGTTTITTPTAAGNYDVTATLTNTNYQAAPATGILVIEKATPVLTITSPSRSISFGTSSISLQGNLKLGSLLPTGTVTATIHTATGSTSSLSTVTSSFGNFTIAFDPSSIPVSTTPYTITYSYSGDANFNTVSDATTTLTVNKATATLTLGSLTHTYDGSVKNATASTTPAGLEGVSISNNGQVNADTYPVVATLENPNYSANAANGSLVISKASPAFSALAASQFITYGTPTVSLSGKVATSAGLVPPGTVTASINGVASAPATLDGAGNFTITYNTATIPASTTAYTITYAIAASDNFNAASNATTTLTVRKADATIVLSNLTQAFTGTSRSVTVTTSPSDLNGVTVTYKAPGYPESQTPPSSTGTYTVEAKLVNNNYKLVSASTGADISSVTGTLEIVGKSTPVFTNLTASQTVSYGTPTITLSGNIAAGTLYPSGSILITIGSLSQSTTISTNGSFSLNFNPSTLNASNTDYTITYSFAENANFNSASDATTRLTINKATATLHFGTMSYTYDGTQKVVTATTMPAGLDGVSVSGSGTDAGSYPAAASLTNTNYTALPIDGSLEIGKAPAVVNVVGKTVTYDGAAHGASGTATGVGGDAIEGLNLGATFINAPGGTASWSFSNPNYIAQSGTASIVINKATATLHFGTMSYTYDGTQKVVTATTMPAGLDGVSVSGSGTDAGSYPAAASLTNTNYTALPIDGSLEIGKAPAVVNVVGKTVTYDGAAHGASGTATGVGGDAIEGLNLGATFINAPGGTASWSFSNPNYIAQSGTASIVINKATATLHFGTMSYTYDGMQKVVTATTMPAGLDGVSVSGSGTDAGSYPAAASLTNTNYTALPIDGSLEIGKAPAVVNVVGKTVTYDGAAHGASGTATGVGGDAIEGLNLGATFINAPGGTASWSFSNPNYIAQSGTASIVINKATATLHFGTMSYTYDGMQKVVTATTMPAGLDGVSVSGSGTDAGSYPAAASLTNTNYTALPIDGSLEIGKAPAVVNVVGKTVTYDGAAHGASGTATGVGGAAIEGLNLGATFINAPGGTASWSFSNPNYIAQSGTASIVINKATATLHFGTMSYTYDGMQKVVTATTMPAGLDGVSVSGSGTDAGSYPAAASLTNTNYTALPIDGSLEIGKAPAVVNVVGKTVTYDGAAHGASGTATGVGGDAIEGLNLGATFINAPGGTASWSFSNPNYIAQSGTASIVINKATATVTVNGKTVTYNGIAHGATGTVKGVNGEDLIGLDLGNSFTNAPGGIANWSFTNMNYADQSGTAEIIINKADQNIVWNNPSNISYGTPLGSTQLNAVITGVTGGSPIGVVTYSPVAGTMLNAGLNQTLTVSVAATTNYNEASKTVSINVNKAVLTVSIDKAYTVQYSDLIPTIGYSVSGFMNGDDESVVAGNYAYSSTATLGSSSTVTSAPGSYNLTPVVSNLSASNYTIVPQTLTNGLKVTKEDAQADYTGGLFVATSSSSSTSAMVTLTATIKDITAVEGSSDVHPGDIRNTKVRFLVEGVALINTSATNGSLTDANGWMPITLVNAGDLKTGTALIKVPLSFTSGDAHQFTIRVEVGGPNSYYVCENDEATVTVYKPLNDFIVGGGFIKPAGSRKTNFGFNVKYNKSGKSLQGNINVIYRKLEADGIVHIYQIKGNSMTSLGVGSANTQPASITNVKTAVFNGKASMQDITNPNAPLSVGGNLTLQVTMTDKGEPGSNDMIGITVYDNAGGIVYSSNWNGTKTQELVLNGGNVVVNSGAITSSTAAPTVSAPQVDAETGASFDLKAFPNPSTSTFNLKLESSNNQKITLRVIDIQGRTVQVFNNLVAGQSLQIGAAYRPGVYIVEMIQGNQRKQMQLIKKIY